MSVNHSTLTPKHFRPNTGPSYMAKTDRCAVCDQEVKKDEALYQQEVEDQNLHFCSTGCRDTHHKRKAAPSKQELEQREAEEPVKK
jgi:hypothetical protein